MLLDKLTSSLPPPANPKETGSNAAWGEVTKRFGDVLPTDYMFFIQRYGTGEIGGWLTVLNPFAENAHLNLFIYGFQLLAALRQIKTEFPKDLPYPLFYEPSGLLPWGISIDGDIFCWRTDGLSGNWPVVVIGRHTSPEEFQMPFSQFLHGVLTKELKTLACPEDLPRVFISQ